ncbi:hypothetical protein ACOMHN_022605 [Nucella lapillus]
MEASGGVCRDRYGTFSVGIFQVWTCAQCYDYLFGEVLPSSTPSSSSHSSSSSSSFRVPRGLSIVSPSGEEEVVPDITNASSFHRVCSWLDQDQCHRWIQCCQAAMRCCHRQLSKLVLLGHHGAGSNLTTEAPPPGRDDSSVSAALWRHARDVNETLGVLLSGGGGGGGGGGGSGFCPQTWDGYSCVDDTPAGRSASISCPPYLYHSDPAGEWFVPI